MLIGALGLSVANQIELLDRLAAVSQALRRAEPGADAVAVECVALVHLIAVWRVDELVIGVVERLLVHVEPDQRALGALRCGSGIHFTFSQFISREQA